jgi:ABC-type transport system involved in multi-copper enzyme maturation permease subunit
MILAALTEAALKEQHLAAILLVWFIIGVVVAGLLWPRGRGRKLARQVFALASLGFREGLRLKTLWTVAVISVIPVLLAYFSSADGTHAGRARLILNISLACAELLGTSLIVLLAAFSVAREIESRIMHTLGAKPLPRWSILLGKALGFWAIDVLFVGGLLLFSAVLVRAVPLRAESIASSALTPSGDWKHLTRNALVTRKWDLPANVEDTTLELHPGECFQNRFTVGPEHIGENELAMQFFLNSTYMFSSEVPGVGLKVGYEGEKPFIDRVVNAPQNHTFNIFLPRQEVSRPGTLLVSVISPSVDQPRVVLWKKFSMQLGSVADGFCANLFKAFLLLVLQGWFLALVVTGWSGVLSFPVAAALGLLLVLGGEMSRGAIELMQSNQVVAKDLGAVSTDQDLAKKVEHVLNNILLLLPDFRVAGGPATFVEGYVISGWTIAEAFFWMGVVRCLGWALPGVLLFQAREVGK